MREAARLAEIDEEILKAVSAYEVRCTPIDCRPWMPGVVLLCPSWSAHPAVPQQRVRTLFRGGPQDQDEPLALDSLPTRRTYA